MATLLIEGRSVALKGDTILVRRDGREIGVDASAAPIRDREGTMIGAVLVFYDVTDERRFAAQLSHQARHDPLTGLVNRREFEHRLARALEGAADLERRHAVLYLDLDRFKEVNDACGHAAGDALLREISALLQRAATKRRAPAEAACTCGRRRSSSPRTRGPSVFPKVTGSPFSRRATT